MSATGPRGAGLSHIVKKYDAIPLRPTALMTLHYFPDSDNSSIYVMITEEENMNAICKYNGQDFMFNRSKGFRPSDDDDVYSLCIDTYMMSGSYCRSQAITDSEEGLRSTFWEEVLNDMKELYTASRVMVD